MKLWLSIIGLLVLSFQSHANFWYKDVEFISMENFEVNRGDEKIAIKFDYVINNPNWYSVIIKPSTLNLTIAEVDCGQVFIPEKIKLKKKTQGRYPFVLIGDASKFIKSGFSSIWSIFTRGQVDFTLTGKLKAGLMGITKKWDMDYTYELTMEEFMSFF